MYCMLNHRHSIMFKSNNNRVPCSISFIEWKVSIIICANGSKQHGAFTPISQNSKEEATRNGLSPRNISCICLQWLQASCEMDWVCIWLSQVVQYDNIGVFSIVISWPILEQRQLFDKVICIFTEKKLWKMYEIVLCT